MEDLSSLLSMEEDGSLLILSRISGSDNTLTETFQVTNNFEGDSKESMVQTSQVAEKEGTQTSTCLPDNYVEDLDASLDALLDDEDLWGIQQMVTKEQETLDMIRKSNQVIKQMISISTQSSPTSAQAAGSTQKEQKTEPTTPSSENDPAEVNTPAGKPYQKWLGRISNNFRRRRQPNRASRPNANNTNPVVNVHDFIQDYYRSLGSVSRYIIMASILSFFAAFILLSLYSNQIHSQDMQLFKLQEKQLLSKQQTLERYQEHHENFRENLIHQRYEESRQCQSSLRLCHVKRDELLQQISKVEQGSGKTQTKLEKNLESQRKEIVDLKLKLREVQEQNRELRKEIGQSFSSSYAQLLISFLNILKNRSVQICCGMGITAIALMFLVCSTFSKK